MVGGRRSLLPEILGQTDPVGVKIDFQSIFARSTTANPSEKSSVNTNRKSTTRIPLSLRWTSYVASKGDSKRKTAFFRLKLHFAWRKSATKLLCVKTVSDKVVRYSLAYLFVQKWLVGDVPLNVNFALSKLLLGTAAVLSRIELNINFALCEPPYRTVFGSQ